MFDKITALGYGIVIFAIVLGVGSVIVGNLAGTLAQCAAGYTWNQASYACLNASGGDPTAPTNTAWVSTNYMLTQLGSTALAGWTPAIIAVSVGLLFLGAFLVGRSGKGRY